MEPVPFITHHLVKSEDINHRNMLYAGRVAEWFVEVGFTAAAALTDPRHTVCLEIHSMKFSSSISCGEVICVESKVVYTGRSRIISFVRVQNGNNNVVVEGFITFIYVDQEGKSQPHNIEINPVTKEDKVLYQKAQKLLY
jgi:acyl-CoA hydrolase